MKGYEIPKTKGKATWGPVKPVKTPRRVERVEDTDER